MTDSLKFIVLIIGSFFIILSSASLFADTIHLKNGSKVEGVIEREDKGGVELNLGYGTTTFSRSEIDRIEKSGNDEKEAIWQNWSAQEKEMERRKPEEEKKWRQRQEELKRIRLEQQEAKKDENEFGPKDITVTAKNQTMLVNVLLNGSVKTTLILDSGAANVVLTRDVAEKLGLDLDKLKIINSQMADGRMVQAALTTLDCVTVQNMGVKGADTDKSVDVEARQVEVCVILDKAENGKMENGLLGMSFLKKFKFKADFANSKVTFERLKTENA